MLWGTRRATSSPSADNTATLKNVSGSTVTNYPLRFGRIFMQGELLDAPQILVDGSPVTTQSNVKTRWGDGSVKHAIMSSVVSSMTNNVAKALTFQNQAESSTALTKSEMLAFDFDAVVSLTVGGVTHTASARDMLTADHYTVWCAGQVATTIILCDHSASRTYDLGWDSYHPFRPIFHATFWKDLNKVQISVIGEVAQTQELEDISVGTLSISTGYASPSTVYTKSSFTMYLCSRWIKRFWIGGAPATAINFDHNLSYLKETYGWANFDTSLIPPEVTIAGFYTSWNAASKSLYDAGLWQKAMQTTGGRYDLGPIPTWTSLWLHSGDYRMAEIGFGQADLSAAWPIHFREGVTTKRLLRTDVANSGTGFGLPISATDRKTTVLIPWLWDFSDTVVGDRVAVVGTFNTTAGGWEPDVVHQPDPYFSQYALTGDYFYLEQMQMWAASSVHYVNGSASSQHYGRGPTGAEGGIMGVEARGVAWGLRGRCLACYWSPDGDPMQEYFQVMVDDQLAMMEGKYGITTGTYNGTTNWQWQYNFTETPHTNPLHFIDRTAEFKADLGNPPGIGGGQSNFMVHYLVYALGVAKEMGFNADTMLHWLCDWHIGMATDPNFNPYMMATYRQATTSTGNTAFLTSWAAVKAGGLDADEALTAFASVDDSNIDGAYEYIAVMSSAYANQYTGGPADRAWCETNGYDVFQDKETCPKWAILPR